MKYVKYIIMLILALILASGCKKDETCKRCWVETTNPQNISVSSEKSNLGILCGNEMEYIENYEGHVGPGSYQKGFCEEQ